MANLKYIRRNRINEELNNEVRLKRKIILAIGIPLTVAAAVFQFAAGILAGLATFLVCVFCSKDHQKEAGAEGEEVTLSFLSQLPDEYYVFRQVEVPSNGNARKKELDFIVCGPNGIFVIESKGLNGTVSGSEEDKTWTLTKTGRRGEVYTVERRNPVRQVKSQIYALKQYLRSKGLDEWICGFVALSNENTIVGGINVTSLPVVFSGQLPGHLIKHRNRHAVRNLNAVIIAIAELVPAESDR